MSCPLDGIRVLMSGISPTRVGNAHPNIVPYQTFATSDGHFILAIGNDSQFRRFCETAGCSELADNELFANNPARVANRVNLDIICAKRVCSTARQ